MGRGYDVAVREAREKVFAGGNHDPAFAGRIDMNRRGCLNVFFCRLSAFVHGLAHTVDEM
jgi:hypothetical protein